ncbi:MAG: hypothetical protein DMD83_07190 [Candidatus Rokuibacteriota bacterium]|nr:MAG: hypothetical protein DMD83_07190 [Candidatus Rokubacteria bacterium]
MTGSNPRSKRRQRLGVIVPFRDSADGHGRNRRAHLGTFLPYMRRFLTAAGAEFRIVVVEQTPGAPFNKGALCNAGFLLSAEEYDYFAFHDLDQLPTDPRNTYACPGTVPVHLCSASSQYGYRPAYASMVGGALLMSREQYRRVNGFSNRYWGWGLEDDDMYVRIRRVFGRVARLPRTIGRYRALPHPRVADLDRTAWYRAGRLYLERVIAGAADFRADGLGTLQFAVVEESHRGHDHYVVDLPNAACALAHAGSALPD